MWYNKTETNLYEIRKALFGDLVNHDKLILFIRNRNFESSEICDMINKKNDVCSEIGLFILYAFGIPTICICIMNCIEEYDKGGLFTLILYGICLLSTSPSPRDKRQ